MPRTRDELINNLMDENSSFILGNGAGIKANEEIRRLLLLALKDDAIFEEVWRKFFRDTE